MERIPEPELMAQEAQAAAYAGADFEAPHSMFVERFRATFPEFSRGSVLDLGCGPGDITVRLAEALPGCSVDGVDGAAAMLRHGERALAERGVADRVRLVLGYLPGAALPERRYDAVVSNSLLHHLRDPAVLWQALRQYGAPGGLVFVMDLLRPVDLAAAQALVEQYAADEPEVLRHDFYHSLLAAYRPAEVRAQLAAAGLGGLTVEVISDRHLLVAGRLPGEVDG